LTLRDNQDAKTLDHGRGRRDHPNRCDAPNLILIVALISPRLSRCKSEHAKLARPGGGRRQN
jgi:hypothetical protein